MPVCLLLPFHMSLLAYPPDVGLRNFCKGLAFRLIVGPNTRRRWRRRRRGNRPLTAWAVPAVVIVNDEASHAAITREVRATVAVDQFTAGKHQATRAAGPSVLQVRSEMAVTGGARRIKYRTLRGEACFADDPVFER